MAEEKLTPERTARLLRAKAAELEHRVLIDQESLDVPMTTLGLNMLVIGVMADIAIVAELLADEIERVIELRKTLEAAMERLL
jgi:hypothetical protein